MAGLTRQAAVARVLASKSLTLQLRCDAADILTGLRPAARVMVRPGVEARLCVELLVSTGLSVSVARGFVLQQVRRSGGVIDWRSQGEGAPHDEKFVVLYCARHQKIADDARARDESKDDTAFGLSLGYPRCCVARVARVGRVPEHREVFLLYASNGVYSPLCWPGAMSRDASLLVHYPCSASCEHSRVLAASRLEYIRESAPADVLEKVRKAHLQTYWLTETGTVCSGVSAPFNCLASASPDSPLYP